MIEAGVETPIIIEDVKTIENTKAGDVPDAQAPEAKVNISSVRVC